MIPPVSQRKAMAELISLADRTSGRELRLGPHRGWTPTTCPGEQWAEWVLYLRDFKEDDMGLEWDTPLKMENKTRPLIEWLTILAQRTNNNQATINSHDTNTAKHGAAGQPHSHPHDHDVPAGKTGVN